MIDDDDDEEERKGQSFRFLLWQESSVKGLGVIHFSIIVPITNCEHSLFSFVNDTKLLLFNSNKF